MISPRSVMSVLHVLAIAWSSSALATSEPKKVATVSPWPAISQLISYQDRVWFVNSNPYQDTNAADIYSYAPKTGTTRFERSLFSQDAGVPVIHNGLLHWPFEDPRRSAGTGEYAVTNGEDWRWQFMDTGHAMHVHALATCANKLVGVTGSWSGQLLQQNLQTDKWDLRYDYPSGAAAFSRLIAVTEFQSDCYVAGSANRDPQVRLLRVTDGNTTEVQGWPASDRVEGLTVHADSLYAWSDTGSSRQLYSYDGVRVALVKTATDHRVRDLHSTGNALFMISSKNGKGVLWNLNNKSAEVVTTLPFVPHSLTSHGDKIYVGSYKKNGADLWAIDIPDSLKATKPQRTSENSSPPALNASVASAGDSELEAEFRSLSSLITDPRTNSDKVDQLRAALGRPEFARDPGFGKVLTRLLEVPLPDTTVTMFTRRELPWQDVVHWYLLHALSINGNGRVDVSLLQQPWTRQESPSQKYFDTTVAAIVATGWLAQNDHKTLQALISRLDAAADPAWLQSDVTGALSAITDQPFGSNKQRWKEWWTERN